MAIPNLAMIPSGYKAGTLYSVLPTDGVGDFTVTRASGNASRINKEGLIEFMGADVPRLDYSGGGCPVLLTEPQSTNIITYSEDFTQSFWTGLSNASLSTTSTITPSGSTNAVRVTSLVGDDDLRGLVTIANGSTYTNSCWIRRVSGSGTISIVDVNGVTNSIASQSGEESKSWKSKSPSCSLKFFVQEIRIVNSK